MNVIGGCERKTWNLRFPDSEEAREAVLRLSEETGLSLIAAKLLFVRGYRTAEAAKRFFRLEEAELHDPFLMKEIDRAAERLCQAIENGEQIAIYGDYDVDGVTSVSLLYLYLRESGVKVSYYIPSRRKEGYGLSKSAMDSLRAEGVDLIVTVDTGITAYEETAYARSLGMEVIVTDHHECREELPQAYAVVNPHRRDDSYPFTELAGVGVAFKLVCACEMLRCRKEGIPEYTGISRVCERYADLVAIGTIADVMPVTDENRLIIAKGLSVVEKHARLGLSALTEAASAGKAAQRKITSTYISFGIAPRLNAAGRVSSASIAVELLLADTKERADELAQQLCELNTERQTEENRIAEEAYRKIEAMPESERSHVIVVDDDEWHQGIVGIVSSRVTERYGLPSILISYQGASGGEPSGSDEGKGSGRSIKGMNLVEALASCKDLLVRFGGHELAAGLSVRRSDVPEFRRRLNEFAKTHLSPEAMCVGIDADCEVEMRDLSPRLVGEIDSFEPFGISNPVPNFVLRDATVQKIQPIGGGKHLRLTVEKDGIALQAVWFGHGAAGLGFDAGDRVDLLFQLNVNEYQGVRSLQMILQDARTSEREENALLAARKRYEEIRNGAEFSPEEEILPDRDDVAQIYQFLRREYNAERTSFPMRRLLSSIRTKERGSYSYGKMKTVIRVLEELQLCGVTEPVPDHFVFEVYSHPIKTNLDKSSILRKLRSQQKKNGSGE